MRFAKPIMDEARRFMRDHMPRGGKFIAVHWRHGDIFNMFPAEELRKHGSRVLMKRVRDAMRDEFPGQLESDVRKVFLLTNCHYAKELEAVAEQARTHLGVELVRYTDPDWVKATAVDLAVASQADYVFFTHCGSFFTQFIEQERDMNPQTGEYEPHWHPNRPVCLQQHSPM